MTNNQLSIHHYVQLPTSVPTRMNQCNIYFVDLLCYNLTSSMVVVQHTMCKFVYALKRSVGKLYNISIKVDPIQGYIHMAYRLEWIKNVLATRYGIIYGIVFISYILV